MVTKTALIAGATGLTGSALLNYLIASDDYKRIIVLSRNHIDLQHEKVLTVLVDFKNLTNHKELMRCDDVFCCLGTTIKKAKTKEAFKSVDYEYPTRLAAITKETGAKKFLIVSSMGASKKSLFFYSRVKGAMENAVREIQFDSLHIFRPSLLLGKRREFRFGENMGGFFFKILSWLLIGNLKQYKSIKADTVAKAMCIAAQTNKNGHWVYQYNEIHELTRQTQAEQLTSSQS